MSTRWYPLFQHGNPQLRVFLPNFWMKLIKPEIRLPPYMAQFHISPEMTEYDVKNYLKKIYNLPVLQVRTEILMGSLGIPDVGSLVKKDDIRLAHVTFRRDFTVTIPDVIRAEQREADRDQLSKGVDEMKKHRGRGKSTGGGPTWFS